MGAYRLTQKADDDLAGLYRYGIEEFGLTRANAYYDSLIEKLAEIGDAPMMCQASDYREGYRRGVHPPHTIYFRVIGGGMVEIVRILRGQDPREEL